jgi:two-component system sensor histidine kinase KdpD
LTRLLARRPAIALVDELAHRNVPGSRHERRWQDVEELLDAGIDVYTTVNIQHLESLNDLVHRITGVRVSETVPGCHLRPPARHSLVDLPPRELIERLKQGKVYMPEQAAHALQAFFSPSNLTALRELAMQTAAERVDSRPARSQAARGLPGIAVAPILWSRSMAAVIPNTWCGWRRMAERRGAPWSVVTVHTGRPPDDALPQRRADNAPALADRLGGRTPAEMLHSRARELGGRCAVSLDLLDAAATRGARSIVIGRTRERPIRPHVQSHADPATAAARAHATS